MKPAIVNGSTGAALPALGVLALWGLCLCPELSQAEASAPGVEACLGCHANTREKLRFANGSERSLLVSGEMWKASIHGAALLCTECHQTIRPGSHPDRDIKARQKRTGSAKAYVRTQSESCKRCHYAYYSKAMDGIHFKLRSAGNEATPSCGDCHPAHSMKKPENRLSISMQCGRCHATVYESYTRSVHGRALANDETGDVPVCTDCHAAHAIADPKSSEFHATIPSLCAKCHSDPILMKKHGLDTSAYDSYLDDFHGKSNRMYEDSPRPPPRIVASCTDCHGAHDIQSSRRSPGITQTQVRERLITSCRKCHGDVPPEFTEAWLSHYPPRLETAPILWTMKKFYAGFNPFMVGIFALSILFDLWRVSARGTNGRKPKGR